MKKITMLFVAVLATSIFSQTATVPVTVNVAANVSIQPSGGASGSGESKVVQPNTETIFTLQLGTTSVSHMARNPGSGAVSVNYGPGAVSLNLHSESYKNAQVSLFSINGRQILRANTSAQAGGSAISQTNIAEGVYLLSIKGEKGASFTTKLVHSGGRLNINIAYVCGNSFLAKQTASSGAWTITATPTQQAGGYRDTSYSFSPTAGQNPRQNIVLRQNVLPCPAANRGLRTINYAPGAPTYTFANPRNLDLTLPNTGNGPFPLVIYIHGGGFTGGSKGDVSRALVNNAPSRGYALASINHRLAANGRKGFPEGIEDILAAIRFLRANAAQYCLDPDRFAVTGFSAGGYHAGLVTALSNAQHTFNNASLGNPGVSSAVQVGVTWSGLSDLSRLNVHTANSGVSSMVNHNNAAGTYLAGRSVNLDNPGAADATVLQNANPLRYVNVNTPPLLMQSARNDNVVPWLQSQYMVTEMNKIVSGRATHDDFQTGGHDHFNNTTNATRVWAFIDNALGVTR